MYDPELLQVIRQEVILYAGMPELGANLFFIEPDILRSHIERLFFGGELAAVASIEGGRLLIDIRGLTAIGLQALGRHDAATRTAEG